MFIVLLEIFAVGILDIHLASYNLIEVPMKEKGIIEFVSMQNAFN